jgi:cation:H+ antiporter
LAASVLAIRATLATVWAYIWPMGGVLSGSLLVAWATEVLSFFLSRGLAFALLAFLQVLPEFAVEAAITLDAADGVAAGDPSGLALISANFTGANRLIVGLFLPLVFLVAAAKARRAGGRLDAVHLPRHTSVEVVALITATVYSFLIPLKGTLTLADAVILTSLYAFYLWSVYRLPSIDEDHGDLPLVPRKIRMMPVTQQKWMIVTFFVAGGVLLLVSIEPFLHNTEALARLLGLTQYFLVQWLAPFLSEFPEFITILYWAKTNRATLGVTNAVSSKVNQWTLLLAMIPVVFLVATWRHGIATFSVPFDHEQRIEILLTAAQSLFAATCLLTLAFKRWHAWTILLLWATQLLDPLLDPIIHDWFPFVFSPFGSPVGGGHIPAYIREWYVFVYIGLAFWVVYKHRGRFPALDAFADVFRHDVLRRGRPEAAEGVEPGGGAP